MRIYLTGIEWLTQPPAGNRLRWWYPLDDDSTGSYLGFTEAIVVERARLDEDIPQIEPGAGKAFPATGSVPYSWWDTIGNVNLAGIDLPVVHSLVPAVQALRFTYRGPTTRLLLRDSSRDATLLDTVVADGEHVRFESADIDEVVVYAHSARLEDLDTLDMFAPRGLDWKQIAIVGGTPTLGANLGDVVARHGGGSMLSEAEWGELVQMAQEAAASTPADAVPGEPNKWESFNLTLSLRWELAALFGMGYFDGPHADVSHLDEIDTSVELAGPELKPLAYRVRDRLGVAETSNIMVCAPWPAPPLTAPGTPQYVDPQVRFNPDGTFDATVEMRWLHSDPRALGVAIEEEISNSPSIGGSPVVESFEHRSRMSDDPPGLGRVARAFDVSFHDVTLRSTARASDAWDRLSPASPASPDTALALYHEPVPPGLRPGTYNAGTVRLPRQLGNTFVADWTPDVIVQTASGRVTIYRQVAQPRVETATAQLPAEVTGDRHRVRVSGVTSLGDFDGGYMSANGIKYTIVDISGSDVIFDAPGAGNSAVALFPPGPATLQQDDKDVSLWTAVADFPAVGLPDELVFNDSVPGPTGGTDVLSYVARVAFLGHLGPASNVAQVIRIANTPPVPPSFSVDLLGVDFYDRTMVKIRLTNPVASGRFAVWWADGSRNAAQFADHAVPGEYGAQPAHAQRYLFDVLSIPIPENQVRTVTIGVQAESAGGGQSGFTVVPVLIPT